MVGPEIGDLLICRMAASGSARTSHRRCNHSKTARRPVPLLTRCHCSRRGVFVGTCGSGKTRRTIAAARFLFRCRFESAG